MVKVLKLLTKNHIIYFKDGRAAPANIECFDYGIMSSDYYAFENWEDFLSLIDKPMGSGIMTLDSWEQKQFILLKKIQIMGLKTGLKLTVYW